MRSIFNFNHVSKDLTEDEMKRFKDIYKHYHRLTKCYGKMYKKCRRKDIILIILKMGLIACGAGGTVLGCITVNPILLASMSGLGLLIGGYMRKVNLARAIDRHNFAFKNYKRVLNRIREFMRGNHFDQNQFDGELRVIDDLVREMCQEIPSGVDNWYYKEYESNS